MDNGKDGRALKEIVKVEIRCAAQKIQNSY